MTANRLMFRDGVLVGRKVGDRIDLDAPLPDGERRSEGERWAATKRLRQGGGTSAIPRRLARLA